MNYIEITKEEALARYIRCQPVRVTTNDRTLWQLPGPGAYSSHAPANELFYRSLPKYEGPITFYK